MLSTKVVSSRIAYTKTRCGQIIPPQVPTPKHRRSVVLRAAATSETNISDAFSPSRRTILVSVPAALVLSGISGQLPSWADGEFKTFLGYNQVQRRPWALNALQPSRFFRPVSTFIQQRHTQWLMRACTQDCSWCVLQAPDLYLGYGASRDSPPMYSFEYPSDWEEEAVTKTDKSTMVGTGRVMT
jgi:hypothetical protein